MKAITLRNIPPQIQDVIERRAKEEGSSFNKTVLRMLEEAVGLKRVTKGRQELYHDLDHLAGTWSEEEAREFELALAAQRQLDPEAGAEKLDRQDRTRLARECTKLDPAEEQRLADEG